MKRVYIQKEFDNCEDCPFLSTTRLCRYMEEGYWSVPVGVKIPKWCLMPDRAINTLILFGRDDPIF
jgi:hypothetical protein